MTSFMACQRSRKLETCLRSTSSTLLGPHTQWRSFSNTRIRLAAPISQYTKNPSKYGGQRRQQYPVGSGDPFEHLDASLTQFRNNLSKEIQGAPGPRVFQTSQVTMKEPYHLNVYSTKHNTHITWTRPNRDPIISKSAGNLSFKKANRGKYDAAYQLTTFVMTKMQEKGLAAMMGAGDKTTGIELVFRGFGQGREAFTKALMGPEGRLLKDYIVRVTDATRLKFGGTRSRNVRRL